MKVNTILRLRDGCPIEAKAAVPNDSGDVRLVLSKAGRKRLSERVGFPVWKVLLTEYNLEIFLIAERRGADRLTNFLDYEERSCCRRVANQPEASRLYAQVTGDKELEAILTLAIATQKGA